MTNREQQIADRLAKATPGPWEWQTVTEAQKLTEHTLTALNGPGVLCRYWDNEPKALADAALIANAPSDLAYLLARVAKMEAALKHIGNHSRVAWASVTAREALRTSRHDGR